MNNQICNPELKDFSKHPDFAWIFADDNKENESEDENVRLPWCGYHGRACGYCSGCLE